MKSNKPSAKGFLHNTSQFIFLDALSVMNKLVKVFQVCDVDFSILKPIVQSAILTLKANNTRAQTSCIFWLLLVKITFVALKW